MSTNSASAETITREPDGAGLIQHDPWLEPYADKLRQRYAHYVSQRRRLLEGAPTLLELARGHDYFGLNRGERDGQPGVWYREWAPAAHRLAITGDFNNWNRHSEVLTRDDFGVWSIFLPDATYADRLTHGSLVKVHVESAMGAHDRLPAYIRCTQYDPETHHFTGRYWAPPTPYQWRHETPALVGSPRIYEAHVGMATEEERIGTYREFTELILPRIASGGYNVVQLMAVQEHPYYGSFGYQVSNFFAPSCRFGTPDELKALIDAAHGLGLRVYLDLVHSHAVKNMHEGLNRFDGSEHQYFHPGERGTHPAWDSMCFDYGMYEVLRFLLSNVRYWLEEFRFDGFRFDGVTSMAFHSRGHQAFGSYDDYFAPHTDSDAVAYLQLANEVAHTLRPDAVTIAEDVSGMVGIARPLDEGGVGFDYRLAMGIPDYWIKLLKHSQDEQWSPDEIFSTLLNRRRSEKHVAYAESHDQALVGDKTLSFWLMDKEMYWHMSKASNHVVIDRGIALHKMIRLITFAAGGEAYLNFIGNEFGHPEWVDFPREGNNFSHKYARRQWSLVDNSELRYVDLAAFDRAMLQLDVDHDLLAKPDIEMLHVHHDNKLLVFRRGPLIFAFNFHPTQSFPDYRVGVGHAVDFLSVLSSDEQRFGGHGNVTTGTAFPLQHEPWSDRPHSLQMYLPARTAQVLAPNA